MTLARAGPRFVSADREFAVWNATIGEESQGEAIALTGPLGQATPGEQLVCRGAFTEHPRHGRRFEVETFRSALPSSAQGIQLWLMTRVSGIGPTFARAISLRSVDRAIAAWREVAAIREIETFLFSHGISAGLAVRLLRRYGRDVVVLLEQDPYRLTELLGVGFKIADRIARSLGC